MDEEINFLDYWQVVVKWKWLILSLAIIFALGACISDMRQQKLYKATATIMIMDSGGGGLSAAMSSLSFLGGGGGGSQSQLLPILQSMALAKQVAKNIDKQKYFPLLYKDNKLTEEQKDLVVAGSLRGAVEVQSLNLLSVSIIWKDPDQAAELVNIYVTQLGGFLNARGLNINFHVLDTATPPVAPFNKKGIKKMILPGGGIGLFVGVFLAFLLDYIKKILKKK